MRDGGTAVKKHMVEVQLRALTSDVLDDDGNVTERGGYKTCSVSVDRVDLNWHLFAKSSRSKARWFRGLFEEKTQRAVVGRAIFYDGPVKVETEKEEEQPQHLKFEKLMSFVAPENA